jgi:hypothetical protein
VAPLYSVRPERGAWLVYDANTGQVLTLDGREQAGLSLEQAEEVADRLNGEAIERLLASVANDPD